MLEDMAGTASGTPELFRAILEGIGHTEWRADARRAEIAGRRSAGGDALSAFGRKSVLKAIEGRSHLPRSQNPVLEPRKGFTPLPELIRCWFNGTESAGWTWGVRPYGKCRLSFSCELCISSMSDAMKDTATANDLLKNSSLYREFQAEREEILRHKWIESEKAGHDIGFERALTDWIIKHRSSWRKTRQTAAN